MKFIFLSIFLIISKNIFSSQIDDIRKLYVQSSNSLENAFKLQKLTNDLIFSNDNFNKDSEKIFKNRFPHHYFRCPRGYAVTIDPIDQSENAIVRMLQNFPMIPFSVATKLGVIMLDTELMEEVDPILRRHRGPISYSSAAGIRDIVPESGGEPLPVLHAQFGPCAQPGYKDPVDAHSHMFCAPLEDALIKDLAIRGIRPVTTITVVHHRLDSWKWQFILTNEI